MKTALFFVMLLLSINTMSAGFDCIEEFNDKDFLEVKEKISNIYNNLKKREASVQSKIYKNIDKKFDSSIPGIRKKLITQYGNNSVMTKRFTSVTRNLYCKNKYAQGQIINDFLGSFYNSSSSDGLKVHFIPGNNLHFDYSITFNKQKTSNVELDIDTFTILVLGKKVGIGVDRDHLYYFKRGWPEDITKISKIKNYQSFSLYDDVLIGDNSVYVGGMRQTNIDLKTFKRIEKQFSYRDGQEFYFYYEDDAYYYQKREWGIVAKIGTKTKEFKILSMNVYEYGDGIYFQEDFIIKSENSGFQFLNEELLFGDKEGIPNINIFGKDSKNVYLFSRGFSLDYFGKLEIDYTSLEIIDTVTIKDKNNTFQLIDGKIIKID